MAKSKYANWYSDRRWRAKRASHLARNPLCVMCAEHGRVKEADIVDHVIPHRGDRQIFWKGEVQSLCHNCHSSTKQIMESSPSRIERRQDSESHWNK